MSRLRPVDVHAASMFHVFCAARLWLWLWLWCDSGDGLIVSASMRRSFHLAVVQRSSASPTQESSPDHSRHALHHHRLGAAGSLGLRTCARQADGAAARADVTAEAVHTAAQACYVASAACAPAEEAAGALVSPHSPHSPHSPTHGPTGAGSPSGTPWTLESGHGEGHIAS